MYLYGLRRNYCETNIQNKVITDIRRRICPFLNTQYRRAPRFCSFIILLFLLTPILLHFWVKNKPLFLRFQIIFTNTICQFLFQRRKRAGTSRFQNQLFFVSIFGSDDLQNMQRRFERRVLLHPMRPRDLRRLCFWRSRRTMQKMREANKLNESRLSSWMKTTQKSRAEINIFPIVHFIFFVCRNKLFEYFKMNLFYADKSSYRLIDVSEAISSFPHYRLMTSI